ncbi:MAG: glycosyltransferase family 25 protein [Planctomycetota bacterium]
MLYTGLYINLDSSRDRRRRMEAELSSLGLAEKYQRFDAIRGDQTRERSQTTLTGGQLGCWLSHLAVWRQAEGKGSHLHVLEDDAALSPLLVRVLDELQLDEASWDLIFTDVYFHPPPTPEQFAELCAARKAFLKEKRISLIDLRQLAFTGTTSYLVNHRSLGRLGELLGGKWQSNQTIDVAMQQLIRRGELRARLAFPFLSTMAAESEQSTAGMQGPAIKSLDAFRQAWFYAADPAAIRQRTIDCQCHPSSDPLLELYLNSLRGVLGTLQSTRG